MIFDVYKQKLNLNQSHYERGLSKTKAPVNEKRISRLRIIPY